ncbi:hypothetical protein [Microcoleus asticus]|uniref:Restriction endonuclease subunit R n=1 Tax=Microcoleus asticus IPMA8 TaxID=2563858 RepID=A0ABX2CY60_9CYAN|nr:hypothetical protein [Microcoleus asticus IPMA8]
MVQTIQSKNVTLEELKTLFDLQLVTDDQFFREWQYELPEITDFQKRQLDQIKAGYSNLLEYPPIWKKPSVCRSSLRCYLSASFICILSTLNQKNPSKFPNKMKKLSSKVASTL